MNELTILKPEDFIPKVIDVDHDLCKNLYRHFLSEIEEGVNYVAVNKEGHVWLGDIRDNTGISCSEVCQALNALENNARIKVWHYKSLIEYITLYKVNNHKCNIFYKPDPEKDNSLEQPSLFKEYTMNDLEGYADFKTILDYLIEKANEYYILEVNEQWETFVDSIAEHTGLWETDISEGISFLEHRGFIVIGINEDNFVFDINIWQGVGLFEKKKMPEDAQSLKEVDEAPQPEQLKLFSDL